VAAVKRGASLAVGTDNDPEATHSAISHAALNGVVLVVVQSDGGRGLRPGAFDLVLANLMAPLLRERRDELCALLAPGGTMVLSGLLDVDVAGIEACYAALGKSEVHADGEWAALVFQGRA
jgi:ribosomal protein L11 methyltransferase